MPELPTCACIRGLAPYDRLTAIYQAAAELSGDTSLPDALCVAGVPPFDRFAYIYAAFRVLAGDDTLPSQECIEGESFQDQVSRIYQAVLAYADDESLPAYLCVRGLPIWQQWVSIYNALYVSAGSPDSLTNPRCVAPTFDVLSEVFCAVLAQGGGELPPENLVLPLITGTPDIGETLSVSEGTWANAPTAFTYQWKRDGVNIGGATGNTYLIPSVNGGLSCYVTATNGFGSTTVRADSGESRQLFLCGDSLITVAFFPAAVQSALDTYFGAGKWTAFNVAFSGENITQMETRAQAQVDPLVDQEWGVVFFHEYANTVIGIQGADSGVSTGNQLFAFGEARRAAGGLPVFSTSPYNGPQTGGHNGDQAHIASEMVRTSFAAHDGIGLVDFDAASILANINSNDGIHWTAAIQNDLGARVLAGIVSAGLVGSCGDIEIVVPVNNDLRTYSNPGYVYKLTGDLPWPVVTTPNLYMHISAGTGWDLGTFQILAGIQSFPTVDGNKTLYQLLPAQSTGGLSGGVYVIDNTP